MKTRYVYLTAVLILSLVLLVVWKLDDYYKQDKAAVMQNQMRQQVISLKSSVSSQITQLKNTLSGYTGAIDEGRINWVQLQPFFALAQIQITNQKTYKVQKLFTKSGTLGDKWTPQYLQSALSFKKPSNQAVTVRLFEDKMGQKYMALIFAAEGVVVAGDASYFQKFFDLQRTNRITNVMITTDQIVAAHSSYDYVASQTEEASMDPEKYIVEKEEIRATNLTILSYTSKRVASGILSVPPAVLGLVLGFSLILMGVLYYALAPVEKIKRQNKMALREQSYQNTLKQVKSAMKDGLPKQAATKPLNKKPTSKSISDTKLNQREAQIKSEAPFADSLAFVEAREDTVPAIDLSEIAIREATENSRLDVAKEIVDLTNQKVVVDVRMATLLEPLNKALDQLEPLFRTSEIQIEKELTTTAVYEIDVARFVKAYENILKNAVEALETEKSKKIFVRAYDVGRTTFVEIQDSGAGIAPDEIEKIWQPFHTTKNKAQHMGLGLTEALSIARRYGADLKITNLDSTSADGAERGTLVRMAMTDAGQEKHDESPFSLESEDLISEGMTPISKIGASSDLPVGVSELDIDAILNLDDRLEIDTDETPVKEAKLDIEKELTATQFKVGRQVDVVEDPIIQFKPEPKVTDEFAVKIRRPGKS